MAKKYVDVNQMLIDESEAYMSAQLKVDDMVRNINQIVHMKLQQLLIDAPAADVQEVVRCKNCKHFFRELKGDNHLCMKSFFANPVTPDDYCSYGARMDGEENDKC